MFTAFLNKLIALSVFATMTTLASPALSYDSYFEGGWKYRDNPGGSEYLLLGDGQGAGLEMRGTKRYCVHPGDSYAKMREYISSNWDRGYVPWGIMEQCDGGARARICVQSIWGEVACSTYFVRGWVVFE